MQKNQPLQGQKALVTGASSGIGRAIALAIGKSGASVAVNYIGDPERANEVVKEIEDDGGTAIALRRMTAMKNRSRRCSLK